MGLTVINEHEACPFNGKNERNIIDRIEIKQKEECLIETHVNKIILVSEGKIMASIGVNKPQGIVKGEMFYVGVEQHLKIVGIGANTVIYIFRLHEKIKFCNCFLLEKLNRYLKFQKDELKISEQFAVLQICEPIQLSLISTAECFKSDLICKHFFELKLNEFLFLIGKFYTMEELALFFKDSLSNDIFFSDYIRKNVHKFRTMKELAEAMNYTISGFEKRFKKVFGVSPYQWMKEKKAQRIFYDLSMTDRCLKELVDDHGFKSSNYFSDFCKSNFGASPGSIRKNRGLKPKP